MSQVVDEHHRQSPHHVAAAVVTVSDTRTIETDEGGRLINDLLISAGHTVVRREIVPDDAQRIRGLLDELGSLAEVDAILLTGGTGINRRDQTPTVVTPLLDPLLPGYGELFRMLSYQEVGPAAMLSRAVGGLIGRKVVLTMPGSPNAVRLAMEKLIVPELAHLVREARR